MTEEETLYVSHRVSDMPTSPIPALKAPCSDCGEEVWLSEGMEKYWSTMKIVCTVCALKITSESEDPHSIVIVPEAIKGVAKYLRGEKKK